VVAGRALGWRARVRGESASENYRLSEQYSRLGADPPSDLRLRFEILEAAYHARQSADYREDVTPNEKRRGHRAGLLRFRRACVQCGAVPGAMRPSSCSVCGDF
jgi:mobilome CxxCx(11)CxxC protein